MRRRANPAQGGSTMSLRINDEAPNFTAETTQGKLNLHDWIGNGWAVLFSHPKDFTPVCTTELGYMAGLMPEFEKRNTKIIGLSVDAVGDHARWSKDIEETPGPPRHLPADWRSRAQGREALRHAAGRSGRYIRRPNAGAQCDGTLGLRYRAGQKDQDHADL